MVKVTTFSKEDFLKFGETDNQVEKLKDLLIAKKVEEMEEEEASELAVYFSGVEGKPFNPM